MGAEQSKRNKVCWNCYAPNGTQQCPSCNRYFHGGCLTRSELAAKRTWTCIVCQKPKASEQNDKETDLNTLPVLINGLLQKELFEEFENTLNAVDSSKLDRVHLLKNILKTIKSDQNLPTYSSFEAFNVDVDWILDQYKAIFDDDETNVHIADLLKKVVKEEIDGLRKCSNCYANAHEFPDDWFTMVCNEPHIVAWAKFQGCNYWPVKIMSAVGKKLSVRFFGDHTHADIAAAKCYLFSVDSPAGKAAKTRGGPYHHAFQETNVYIDNIKKEFGTFNYAPLKSAIDPEQLSVYTQQMIPGTGISRTIDPNAAHKNDEGAEVTSSSNDNGSTSTNSSSNSSLATTMDSSVNSQNAVESELHSPDPVDIEEQPAKKARLSTAADNNECLPMNLTNDNNDQNMVNKSEATIVGANENATISSEFLEQVRNDNVCLTHQLKQMSDQLNEKVLENERLQNENRALVDENDRLKKSLEEKTTQINNAEANQQKTPQQVDRTVLIELAKNLKICMGCNAERPLDMLHFCGVSCQKSYLNRLED